MGQWVVSVLGHSPLPHITFYVGNRGVARLLPCRLTPSITTRRGRRPAACSGSPPMCLARTWHIPGVDLPWTPACPALPPAHGPVAARGRFSRAGARTRSPSAPHAAASPTAPTGPPPSEARGRLPHTGQQSKAPAPQGRCDRSPPHGQDHPARTATMTVPPASPDRLCRTLLPKARSPARQRHPRTDARDRAPRPRTRGRPACAPPAQQASCSPAPPSRPSAHSPFPSAPPQGSHRGGHVHMHARLSGSRQAGTRDRRGPSEAVRGRPITAGLRGS